MNYFEKARRINSGHTIEELSMFWCPSDLGFEDGYPCDEFDNCEDCWLRECSDGTAEDPVPEGNGEQTDFKRLTGDSYYMNFAKAASMGSTCLRRQYGAVIVVNDEIIATGYNGAPRGAENCCDVGVCHREGHRHNDGNYSSCPAVHAEQNAIISAARRDMIGGTLYLYGAENGVTIDAEPCPICERLIRQAGLRIVGSKKEINDE